MSLAVGQRVRFTLDNLGAMRKDGSQGHGFTEKHYGTADTGTVELELPFTDDRGDKWFAVTPDDDATVYVPVHPSMVEVV